MTFCKYFLLVWDVCTMEIIFLFLIGEIVIIQEIPAFLAFPYSSPENFPRLGSCWFGWMTCICTLIQPKGFQQYLLHQVTP